MPEARPFEGGCLCGAVRYRATDAPIRQPRLYQSSEFAQRGSCVNCGSTLSMHEEVLADRMLVAVGSLDEPTNSSRVPTNAV